MFTRLNRLNGWQRLWVIIGVIWAIAIAFMAEWPPGASRGPLESKWKQEVSDRVAITLSYAARRAHPTCQEDPDHVYEFFKLSLTFEELRPGTVDAFLNQLKQRAKTGYPIVCQPGGPRVYVHFTFPADVDDISRRYQSQISNVPRMQALWVGGIILFWVISMAILYGAGWAVGWVVRGFRTR